MQRSTFGFGKSQEKTNKRKEIGAIWEKVSNNNTQYMEIQFHVEKEKMIDIINKLEPQEGKIKVNFVAFANNSFEENTKRPKFRIYEESKKD